ncbi:thioredoxin-like protein, partial [Chytridium lagenaria]
DEEDLFAELEKDDDHQIAYIRERRMDELRSELRKAQDLASSTSHGSYEDIDGEKEIMKITTSVDKCVVHFYHKEFRRCQIVNKHLDVLARKHYKTRFVRIDVEKCPFLVERLKVQVLPCIIIFIKGVSVDRIVGFDELGGTDTFNTTFFERRLAQSSKFYFCLLKRK